MKRLLSVLLALTLVLSMSVVSFAAEETEIALIPDNFGANTQQASDVVTWGENSVTANAIGQFSLKLPTTLVKGDTIVLHIKGTSEEQFRVWLLAAEAATAGNQWKSADAGYSGTGPFEFFIELKCEYFDAEFETAEDVNFKAPSWDKQLVNFTLEYVGVVSGTLADVEAATIADTQPAIDAAQALVDAALASTAEADVAAAQAAIDAIADYGFAAIIEAKANLQTTLDTVEGAKLLANFTTQIDAVNKALEDAKAANGDVTAIKAAYDVAYAAIKEMEDGNPDGIEVVSAKIAELKEVINEIKSIHKAAAEAKAEADKAAEEAAKKAEEEAAAAAAKKAATTKTVTIVVIAVAVVAIVAVVIVVISKKNKK